MRIIKLTWMVYLLKTVQGYFPLVCPDGRSIAGYNGTIAISSLGIPCKKWSEMDMNRYQATFRAAAEGTPHNYCHDILGQVGCLSYWTGTFEDCYKSICGFEKFADRYAGGIITSSSGWLAANNADIRGCNWVLQAPIGVTIEVHVLYLYTHDFPANGCVDSYLRGNGAFRIYETEPTVEKSLCGNVTVTVRSRSNELNIRYQSGSNSVKNERFNLTYRHILLGTTRLCPMSWKLFGESCYKIYIEKKNWATARLKCRDEGGYLVEIGDEAEGEFIKEEAMHIQDSLWLGGSDIVREGEWQWVTSKKKISGGSFTDWGTHQPSNYNGNEHCLHIYKTFKYKWNDVPCSYEYGYVCEMQIGLE